MLVENTVSENVTVELNTLPVFTSVVYILLPPGFEKRKSEIVQRKEIKSGVSCGRDDQ